MTSKLLQPNRLKVLDRYIIPFRENNVVSYERDPARVLVYYQAKIDGTFLI